MATFREWLHRLWGSIGRSHRDRELEEELRTHLALAEEDARRNGRSPEPVNRAVRLKTGGVAQAMDALRDQRGLPIVDALARDVRFGARMLMKDHWVTLAAVLALALGIAANNTVFTIVHAILLRDLPFDHPDRIVAIGTRVGNVRTFNTGVSYPDFQDWRAAAHTFDGLGAARETTMNVSDDRVTPERFIGSYISANAFGLLGQRPILGRDFFPDDDRIGAIPVVIIGHSMWRNRYASDPGVLGRTIRVNGLPSVVIGVMPDQFGFPIRSRLWQPLALLSDGTLTNRDARNLTGFGRLARDVHVERAATDLGAIAARLEQEHPTTNRDVTPIVAPYRERSAGGRARSGLPMLMGVVAFVLLIACANVANLLLARGAVRSHEIAVRMAIGAGRSQIIRQLLVESLLLATLAGAVGWGLLCRGDSRIFKRARRDRGRPSLLDQLHDGRTGVRILGSRVPGHRIALRSRAGAADVAARHRQHAGGDWPGHCGWRPQPPLGARPRGVSAGSDPDPAHGRRTDDAQHRRPVRNRRRRRHWRHHVGTPGSSGPAISHYKRSRAVLPAAR